MTKMKTEGLNAVKDFFQGEGYEGDPEKIRQYVANSTINNRHTFHYDPDQMVRVRFCNLEPSDLAFKHSRKGVLQSPLITRTLSAYYSMISTLPLDTKGRNEIPYTAIIYSTASVRTDVLL